MKKDYTTYRRDSLRAKWWNYTDSAIYFITINSHKRIRWFSSIRNKKVMLSPIGKIVDEEWLTTFELRKEMQLWRGEYVIMPDHFHALIGIGIPDQNLEYAFKVYQKSLHTKQVSHNTFGPQRKNLASIIANFKGTVTRRARKIHPAFAWQAGYYDIIVRDARALQNISQYIINNPIS